MSLLLVIALLAGLGGPAGPAVSVRDRSPVVVAGTGFTPGSVVKVTVLARNLRLTRTVAADGSGRFTARWRARSLPKGCSEGSIAAVGGGKRVLAVIPRPAGCAGTGVPTPP